MPWISVFFPHNTHLEDPGSFVKRDPHLRQLREQLLVHRSNLLDNLPSDQPGIYTIGGARQVGVKWTRQLRAKDLKQIVKYPNGRILTRSRHCAEILGIPTEPLPLAMLCLGSADSDATF